MVQLGYSYGFVELPASGAYRAKCSVWFEVVGESPCNAMAMKPLAQTLKVKGSTVWHGQWKPQWMMTLLMSMIHWQLTKWRWGHRPMWKSREKRPTLAGQTNSWIRTANQFLAYAQQCPNLGFNSGYLSSIAQLCLLCPPLLLAKPCVSVFWYIVSSQHQYVYKNYIIHVCVCLFSKPCVCILRLLEAYDFPWLIDILRRSARNAPRCFSICRRFSAKIWKRFSCSSADS